jgi:hypothetical protein
LSFFFFFFFFFFSAFLTSFFDHCDGGISNYFVGNFSLLEEENVGVSLDITEIAPLVTSGKACLVGCLLADRNIGLSQRSSSEHH